MKPYIYCPLCATKLITRHLHGRKRQQCPACEWIYFRDPKVGVGVFVEHEGKVLLARRGVNPGKGLWCFPSGFMEIDETSQETAIRETKEETGYEVELLGLLDVFTFNSNLKGAGVLILYRAKIIGGAPAPMDDVTEIAFFGPDALPEGEIAFESNRAALARWKAEKL